MPSKFYDLNPFIPHLFNPCLRHGNDAQMYILSPCKIRIHSYIISVIQSARHRFGGIFHIRIMLEGKPVQCCIQFPDPVVQEVREHNLESIITQFLIYRIHLLKRAMGIIIHRDLLDIVSIAWRIDRDGRKGQDALIPGIMITAGLMVGMDRRIIHIRAPLQ